jgi:hypothetical protein
MGIGRALGAALSILIFGIPTPSQAEVFRSAVEDAARLCDSARLSALQPFTKAEKDIVVTRSWSAFGRAYETGRKALIAMQGKALWIGPDSAEKGAEAALSQTKKCQAVFEEAISSGGNINLALDSDVVAGDPDGLNYLLSKGANPAARNPAENSATFGMLALKRLAQFDFTGREDRLNAYLSLLIPRMGKLNGVKDTSGLPVVYYALGIDPLVRYTPNQKTVDTIIKRLAAAGADVAAPWQQAYIRHQDRAQDFYRGSDPEVTSLFRGGR